MNALLLAPHNDDAELFASFLCLRYFPHVVVCLRSYRMADPKYPGDMPVTYQEREAETARAMRQLGCSWEQLSHRDDHPDWTQVEADIANIVRRLDPEIIFAPAIEYGNEHHDMIGRIAGDASDKEVVYYLTYTAEGRSRNGQEVEFEPEWIARKLAALACHRTQSAHPLTRDHFIDGGLREYTR